MLLFSLKHNNASSLADMVTLLTHTQEMATSNLYQDINSPEIFLCPQSIVKLQALTDVYYRKLNTSDISRKICCKQKLISSINTTNIH